MLGRRNRVLALDCFGARATITVSHHSLLDAIEPVLPPAWSPCTDDDPHERFDLRRLPASDTYALKRDGSALLESADLLTTLGYLDAALRACIASNAPRHIFIHAGVVEYRGRAIVIPGESFTGKTTLVAALIRAGATYLSDEYAVLDADGRTHPYPRRLSLRPARNIRGTVDVTAESLGSRSGERAVGVGMIVATTYRAGALWTPTNPSSGIGALRLLANAIPARERPQQTLAAVRRAAAGATVLEGPRGEASEIVPHLLITAGSTPT